MSSALTGNENLEAEMESGVRKNRWPAVWPASTKRTFKYYPGQIVQFLVVGGLNAVIDIGMLDLILYIWPTTNDGLLILFNTFAYTLAILNSYIWNSRITFRQHARQDIREKAYFLIQAGISLFLSNFTFLTAFHELTALDLPNWVVQNAAKALAMAIPSTASFLFMKYWVFRRSGRRVKKP
ncbi:GtrA-like protein [Acididesulfobacillus acetoxydans]|uniref:GtrA-like protein n=1 Tax=Acididesulfobacillus acetoxydans TaxID=1561005 RepID=A0A8S0WPT0_9FIRM|nr:GtrA family protein [Acididesulfobacillus acetoxydans]CAA7602144.1 GtrA-like protein [Acididesulfobacillus acetoxydans]CEJ08013.1 GtrA-like protein [Acididesulfobacillus acetoxydans]